MRRHSEAFLAWLNGPVSKPWLLLFLAAVVAIGVTMFVENRRRIDDLCQVIVVSYSTSTLEGLELTQEQAQIIGPILLELSENSAARREQVLAAADCHVDEELP